MFRSWKSAIGRAGEMLNDESTYNGENGQGQVASPEADRDSSPLGRLLDDLKASEARRNGQRPNPEPETPAQPAKVETSMPDDVQTAPVATPAATPTAAPAATPVASDDALNSAQALIAQQRKAAEALLSEVCALEERLKGEAKAAQAAQALAAANEKAKAAVILEQQAKDLAQNAVQSQRVLATERKSAETRIAELQQQLSALQSRAQECAAEETAAERKAAEAVERVTACQAASVAAQKEARAAEDRAEALKKELPPAAQSLAGINEVQTLAVRIAEQASALTRN